MGAEGDEEVGGEVGAECGPEGLIGEDCERIEEYGHDGFEESSLEGISEALESLLNA